MPANETNVDLYEQVSRTFEPLSAEILCLFKASNFDPAVATLVLLELGATLAAMEATVVGLGREDLRKTMREWGNLALSRFDDFRDPDSDMAHFWAEFTGASHAN
jgi:hypothetical protein